LLPKILAFVPAPFAYVDVPEAEDPLPIATAFVPATSGVVGDDGFSRYSCRIVDALFHVGAAAPFETNTCPVVPAAVIPKPVAVLYTEPPLTAVKLAFVPPLASAKVPASTIAPLVGEEGVNPVVPPENVVTATPDKVVAAYVVPAAEYRNCPAVGATVAPVPPLVAPKVPANVTAPVVATAGVRPDKLVWNDVTAAPDKVAHVGAEPVLPTRTCPVVPAAVIPTGLVPLPNRTPFCVRVVTPVPPLPTTSVPATVTAPDVAAAGVRPVVPNEIVVTATPDSVVHDGAAAPFDVRIWPDVPAALIARAPAPL
jgi:hypothetical protein